MNSLTSPQTPAGRSGYRFSIVIPAKNEAATISTCLDALTHLSFSREAWEVIVVDNASTDGTAAIAAGFGDRLNLTVVPSSGRSISAVRNQGAAVATGEILAFLDADCIPGANWLADASAAASPGCITGAYYRLSANDSWVARAWCGQDYVEKQGPVPFLPSGDLIIFKETFSRLGGFDETLETNEDYELCQRALARGIPVVAFSRLAVVHLGTPQTLSAFYRKQRWHGKHVLTVTLRDLRALRNAKAVLYALFTLICLAGVAAGLALGLATGAYRLLAVASSGLLIAPAAVAARLALHRKSIAQFPALLILYLLFGLARARCLLSIGVYFEDRRNLKQLGIDYYRSKAAIYNERYTVKAKGDLLGVRHRALLDLLSQWNLPAGARLVDLGCGPGVLTRDLAKLDYRGVGVDASPAMIEYSTRQAAAEEIGHAWRYQLADVEAIPFARASFDGAVCSGVIDYLSADDTMLSEVARVLKPGGRFLLCVTNRFGYTVSLSAPMYWVKQLPGARALASWLRSVLVGGSQGAMEFNFLPRKHRPAEARAALARHGFEVQGDRYVHFSLLPAPFCAMTSKLNFGMDARLNALDRTPLRGLGSCYIIDARLKPATPSRASESLDQRYADLAASSSTSS